MKTAIFRNGPRVKYSVTAINTGTPRKCTILAWIAEVCDSPAEKRKTMKILNVRILKALRGRVGLDEDDASMSNFQSGRHAQSLKHTSRCVTVIHRGAKRRSKSSKKLMESNW